MLNFFVTMVNTIGVPVMLIGTPKARDIFEADLRSARRGAGLGAIFGNQWLKGEPSNSIKSGLPLPTTSGSCSYCKIEMCY